MQILSYFGTIEATYFHPFRIIYKLATFKRASNLLGLAFFMCARHIYMQKWCKLGLHPTHNTKSVLGTNFEGTIFSRYAVVCKAYPLNEMGNNE